MKPKLSQEDLEMIIDRYKKRIGEFGPTLQSLNSGSPEKQQIRHAVHLSSFRTENPSVLDIGCGLADFYHFLSSRHVEVSYTGYDVVEEYINACQSKIKHAHFESRNIFESGIDGVFDNIVFSQVLNNRYKSSDNFEVMKQAITTAFKHARVAVSIDMMSSYVDFKSDELYYYSPEKVFEFCRQLTKRVIIRHDYRPYEFCVQLFQENAPGYVG
jgi:hypothetical protein